MDSAAPDPPYYAVIFTARERSPEGYGQAVARMLELAEQQPGYLGIDHGRGEDGSEVTVSYWRDTAAIEAWRTQAEHREAQRNGRERWYAAYTIRVARVERAYSWERDS